MERFRVEGKVALVTGGARGLGAVIAATLIEAGARVVVTDLLVDEGARTAAQLGSNAIFSRLDVTQEANWETVIADTVKRFGRFDILVNNAGIEITRLFADITLEEFNKTMAVNSTGVFLGIKHAIRTMRPGGATGHGGSIVNLSSVSGLMGSVGLGSYCSSKGSVRLMTKAAAVECARLGYGIRVNSVHPAVVKTDMGNMLINDYVKLGLFPDAAAAEKAFANAQPLGLGQPQDVASGVCYLASDAARWTTGTELVLDGGLMAA
jgi:3alpha(or 20beta)-hydroxysteroid dehydrogenase